jgi:hypothetical protein
MPRKGKGGKVDGAAQTAYSNRTDLNNRGPQPITAAPGEPYGQRKMLEDAERAVPMGGTPQPATQLATPASTATNQPPAPPAPVVEPGTIPFDGPTERPNEPITAGLHTAYGSVNQNTRGHVNLAATLENAAASPNATPRIQMLAEIAKSIVK